MFESPSKAVCRPVPSVARAPAAGPTREPLAQGPVNPGADRGVKPAAGALHKALGHWAETPAAGRPAALPAGAVAGAAPAAAMPGPIAKNVALGN